MMLDLDDLETRHRLYEGYRGKDICAFDRVAWPCDELRVIRELRVARAVVEAAPEWAYGDDLGNSYCPECESYQDGGHRDCCAFGTALVAYRAVAEGT
jgi:hypothetical protein